MRVAVFCFQRDGDQGVFFKILLHGIAGQQQRQCLLILQMFKRKGLQDSFAFFTVGGLVHHLSPAVDVQFNAGIYVYADDGCFRVVQAVAAQAAGGKEQETGKGYRPLHSEGRRLSAAVHVFYHIFAGPSLQDLITADCIKRIMYTLFHPHHLPAFF